MQSNQLQQAREQLNVVQQFMLRKGLINPSMTEGRGHGDDGQFFCVNIGKWKQFILRL